MTQARIPAPLKFLAVLGLLLFLLPLAGLIARAPWNQIGQAITAPETVTALGLSLFCSVTATLAALVLGIPLALVLARTTGTTRGILRAVTTLPMVLPPSSEESHSYLRSGEEAWPGPFSTRPSASRSPSPRRQPWWPKRSSPCPFS